MVRKFRKRVVLRISLRKFIYLISPNKINNKFFFDLDKVLAYGNTAFFQLRLKNTSYNKIIKISKKIKKITDKHKVKFIINDYYKLVFKIKADGCHVGQLDESLDIVKKKLKKKIIGITCHNSKIFALNSLKYKPDYIAFGSLYKSRLKPRAIKADLAILKWAKKNIKKPIVGIGGINNKNYEKIVKSGAKYIAISSYIWDNPDLKPEKAIKEFK